LKLMVKESGRAGSANGAGGRGAPRVDACDANGQR
jgi:hypothetical protein